MKEKAVYIWHKKSLKKVKKPIKIQITIKECLKRAKEL
jgi:hypothetical protein